MISKNMLNAMNEQIKHEFYSAYMYLSMAAFFEANNLPGFANWMKKQAEEESEHAMKFFEYINDQGESVKLLPIDQPPVEFETPTKVFEQVLEHEKSVTALIIKLYELAVQEKDFASQIFLNWFVEEQVEEEKSASEVLETLKMAGEKGTALFMIDRQLSSR